jgi:hypothetical protein
LVDIDGFGRKQ